jgi:hypothetical protein
MGSLSLEINVNDIVPVRILLRVREQVFLPFGLGQA